MLSSILNDFSGDHLTVSFSLSLSIFNRADWKKYYSVLKRSITQRDLDEANFVTLLSNKVQNASEENLKVSNYRTTY